MNGILFLDELTEFRRDAEEARLDVCDLAAKEAPSGGWLSTRRTAADG
jgi:hypothetical protein